MNRVRTFRVVAGLAVALSAAVEGPETRAQGPGADEAAQGGTVSLSSLARSVGSGPQTSITVLMAPAVQKELKLAEAQKNKVYNLSVAATDKQRDLVQSLFMGGGAEGGMDPRGIQAARDALRRENELAIARILDDKQQERFDQLVLRAEGPLAVARPEVASKLRLNDTQREYVQSIMMQMQRNQFMMFARLRQGAAMGQGQVGPGQVAQLREMMAKVRDDAVQQLGKVIDAKQKAAFNKMLGEPFDLAKLDAEAGPESGTAAATPSPSVAATAAKPAQDPAADEAGAKEAPTPEKGAKGSGRTPRKKTRPRAKPSE